jgi:hypothetical protein
MTTPKRPKLCRIGLHFWRTTHSGFTSLMLSGFGKAQECQRCGKRRVVEQHMTGATIIHDCGYAAKEPRP